MGRRPPMSGDGSVNAGIADPSTSTSTVGNAMPKKAPTGSRTNSLDSTTMRLRRADISDLLRRFDSGAVGQVEDGVLESGPVHAGHVGVADESGRGVQREHPTAGEHGQPVAQALGLVHEMGDQEDGDATVADRADQ